MRNQSIPGPSLREIGYGDCMYMYMTIVRIADTIQVLHMHVAYKIHFYVHVRISFMAILFYLLCTSYPLQLMRRNVVGVRRMAPHPTLAYCESMLYTCTCTIYSLWHYKHTVATINIFMYIYSSTRVTRKRPKISLIIYSAATWSWVRI